MNLGKHSSPCANLLHCSTDAVCLSLDSTIRQQNNDSRFAAGVLLLLGSLCFPLGSKARLANFLTGGSQWVLKCERGAGARTDGIF